MIFRYLYMYFTGVCDIVIEGFSIEKFINECKNEKIFLWKLEIKNNAILSVRISYFDLEKVKKIAFNNSCRIEVIKEKGLPILWRKYKYRRILIGNFGAIVVSLFIVTRFIWNIEISGNDRISKEEILSEIGNYGIAIGKLKHNLNLDEIQNQIRMENEDISWIGISVKGTNVKVEVSETTKANDILDKSKQENIIADCDSVISKIVVRSGSARVNVGDEVKKGDLLVENVMEGKYTGIRSTYCDADIFGINNYEKCKTEKLNQAYSKRTGKKETFFEIYLKNFKIIFNKTLPKFQKYDTIRTYKKLKLFSNYFLPIEIIKISNFEVEEIQRCYSEQELVEKIENDLYNETVEKSEGQQISNVEYDYEVIGEEIMVKMAYIIEKKIGTIERE